MTNRKIRFAQLKSAFSNPALDGEDFPSTPRRGFVPVTRMGWRDLEGTLSASREKVRNIRTRRSDMVFDVGALPYGIPTNARREPEQIVLHRVFLEHLETFLDGIGAETFALQSYVERELRAFVECGVLADGFVRIRCDDDSGKTVAVAFSCKGRGFYLSCTGRRMADTSARLVDEVFPPEVSV